MRLEAEARGKVGCTRERASETSEESSGKNMGRFGYSCSAVGECAARAFCDCPAIISLRPRSQNILKEPHLNPEEDSRIKRARSHVSLEKSS
jgi:hypothetical protein